MYASFDMPFTLAQQQNKQQVTLTAMLNNLGNPTKWDSLFQSALSELRTRALQQRV